MIEGLQKMGAFYKEIEIIDEEIQKNNFFICACGIKNIRKKIIEEQTILEEYNIYEVL